MLLPALSNSSTPWVLVIAVHKALTATVSSLEVETPVFTAVTFFSRDQVAGFYCIQSPFLLASMADAE